jgi:hypothetical protein
MKPKRITLNPTYEEKMILFREHFKYKVERKKMRLVKRTTEKCSEVKIK